LSSEVGRNEGWRGGSPSRRPPSNGRTRPSTAAISGSGVSVESSQIEGSPSLTSVPSPIVAGASLLHLLQPNGGAATSSFASGSSATSGGGGVTTIISPRRAPVNAISAVDLERQLSSGSRASSSSTPVPAPITAISDGGPSARSSGTLPPPDGAAMIDALASVLSNMHMNGGPFPTPGVSSSVEGTPRLLSPSFFAGSGGTNQTSGRDQFRQHLLNLVQVCQNGCCFCTAASTMHSMYLDCLLVG
jgi:hypothetical protein